MKLFHFFESRLDQRLVIVIFFSDFFFLFFELFLPSSPYFLLQSIFFIFSIKKFVTLFRLKISSASLNKKKSKIFSKISSFRLFLAKKI